MHLKNLCKDIHNLTVSKGFWDHDRNFGELLMLIVSEVSEAMEEYRKHKQPDEIYYVNGKPEGIPIELADVILRIADLCEAYEIDIEEAIAIKFEYNKTRPYRHGDKAA